MAFPLSNLISYWKLDETSGNAFDSAGSNLGTNTAVTYAAGKIKNGGIFNGSSSKLALPMITLTNTTFSISMWVNLTATGAGYSFFGQGNTGNNNPILSIGTTGNNIEVINRDGSLVGLNTSFAHGMSAGTWYHVVWVCTTTNSKTYVNGTLLDNTNFTANTATLNTTNIGARQRVATDYMNGGIDEVGIWSRALSSTEVTDLYNSGNGLSYPLTGSLVSYYKLDANSNDSVTTNNGTDTNISYATAGKIGNCATFNGSSSTIGLPDSFRSTSFTVSTWAKTSATGKILFGNTNYTSSVASGYFFYANASGNLEARTWNGSNGVSVDTNSTKNITDGLWHHVVMTCSGGTVNTLYVDGIQVATATGTSVGWSGSTNYVYLGAYNFSGLGNYWNGSIDETAIWSRALTADEVSQVFNSGRGNAYPLTDTPSLYGGVAYYKLDESSGNASDSINGKTLTANGTVTYGAAKINNGASATWNDTNYLTNSSLLASNLGTGDITMACWFKKSTPSTQDYTPTIMSLGVNSGASNYRIYLVTEKTTGYAILASYDGTGTNVSSTVNIANNSYHYVVGTRSGTTMKIYVDGTEVASATGTARNITGNSLKIGTVGGGIYDVLGDATIDEVGIWNRALSSTEVTALYNSGNGSQYPFSISAYILSCVTGAFTLTGNAVNLTKSYFMQMATGAFNLVGNAVNLILGGITWTNQTKSTTNWSNTTKNSSSWTNTDKNDTTWTNITKS